MSKLSFLQAKKKKLVVGLMSGTSVDSIDAVLVEISGSGTSIRFKQIAFYTHQYPNGYKKFVVQNSLPGSGSVDTLSTLNILSAHFFVDAVKALAKKAKVPLTGIDLIGSHGQTIHHLPEYRTLFGKKVHSTLQIGDPSTIAKLTGIVTVGDFRTGDMALGGQGAPLVPYFDYIAFRSTKKNRALLNIGGIANITLLKKNCSVTDVSAFDTGPGNMVIDALMNKMYNKPFDHHGNIASRGKILSGLLETLLHHPYFVRPLPKSTGREMFGDAFVEKILKKQLKNIRGEDIIATATEFTAITIYDQFNRFLRKRLQSEMLDELIVSGGGSKNGVLMDTLQRYFSPTQIITSDSLGVSSDAKEALCFAILANETVAGNNSNIPNVTGASHGTILGKICL
ncbi:MAG: anhydro-N-acetylmuramic acid kinase [Bacteroidota bacterium]|nr:anhydro-N-acetylmuramic acid kinase [Bacteroidota bacterium]